MGHGTATTHLQASCGPRRATSLCAKCTGLVRVSLEPQRKEHKMKKRRVTFRVGDTVRLMGYRRTTKIKRFVHNVHNVAALNRALGGYYEWSVDELILVRRARRRKG